jgi:RNA polymerase sigma factor (sigma-70 family)
MITTTALLLWKLVAVFLVVIAILDLLTMRQEHRIRLYKLQGLSQRTIADRLGISRYAVRQALAQ